MFLTEHFRTKIIRKHYTWILLRDIELGGERNRAIYILKSRGMAHSNQLREFLLTDRGIELLDVYLGPEGVLTGSMRQTQEAREKAALLAHQQEMDAKERELSRRREALEARITAMRKEFEAEEHETQRVIGFDQRRTEVKHADRERMAQSRKADVRSTGEAQTASLKTQGKRS